MFLQNLCYLGCNSLGISIGIGGCFAYSRWYLKNDGTCIKFGTCTQWNYAQTIT